MKAPAMKVELKGATPIVATRYECQVPRCADCQQTFTASLPDEATGTKYDASLDATLAVMRYGLGVPHNRLAQFQQWAGIPLPASSQFERVEVMANAVSPVVRHLAQLAATRPLLQSDDTGARILSLQAENQTRGPHERTGLFTTGIVAKSIDDSLVALRAWIDEQFDQRVIEPNSRLGPPSAIARTRCSSRTIGAVVGDVLHAVRVRPPLQAPLREALLAQPEPLPVVLRGAQRNTTHVESHVMWNRPGLLRVVEESGPFGPALTPHNAARH
jgi:hypothetical protein